MVRALISAIFFIFLSGFSQAQDIDPSRLEELKNREAEAKLRESEIQSERKEVAGAIVVLSKNIKEISSTLAELETDQAQLMQQVSDLEEKQKETSRKIATRKSSITDLLAALQRIESNPPPTLATHPNDAAKASRAGLLLRNLTRQISERVEALNIDLVKFDQLHSEIEVKQNELNLNRSAMNEKRNRLEKQVVKKNALEKSLNADYAKAHLRRLTLAEEAQSLQELIDRLERKSKNIIPRIKPDPKDAAAERTPETDRSAPSSEPITFDVGDLRFSGAKGKLYPVTQGKLSKRYTSAHPGMSIHTGNGAQVFAPARGRVEFAGPFKNHDQVIILNVGDGYYVLLTGLDRLLVQDDSKVSAGDPVGLMSVNSSNDKKLYIELRKNGSTINPVPWFGTTFAKPNNG